jgi:hypothetical protein
MIKDELDSKKNSVNLQEFITLGMDIFEGCNIPAKNGLLCVRKRYNKEDHNNFTFSVIAC